ERRDRSCGETLAAESEMKGGFEGADEGVVFGGRDGAEVEEEGGAFNAADDGGRAGAETAGEGVGTDVGGAEGDREGDGRARGQRTAAGLRFARFDGGGERRGEPGGESGGVRFDVVRGAREHAQDRDFRERSALSVERKRRLQGGKCELV